jgi:hypothetical protein
MKCENCNSEMSYYSDCPSRESSDHIIEWCKNCGTLIHYYNGKNNHIENDCWETPKSFWHPEAYDQGVNARLMGFDVWSQNIWRDDPNGYGCKSFLAGWFDTDNDPSAPKEKLRSIISPQGY